VPVGVVRGANYRFSMIIDCGSCAHSPSRTGDRLACDDCVVSVLLGPMDDSTNLAHIADEHERAVGVLADSGLVPPLRLVRPSRAS
jgi:hypothetical protein